MSAAPFLDPGMFDDAVAAVALLMGPEHRLVYVNPAFTRLFGPRTLGLPAREAFPEPDASRFLGVLEDVRGSGRPRQVTGRRRTDPGAPSQARHFVYSCTPVATRRGAGILAIAMDTTAETYTLQRYEALATAVSQMVWVMWPNGTMDELVPGWEAITGLPWRSRADDAWYDVVHPRDRENLRAAWMAAAAEPQNVFEHTFRVRTAAGSYRHMFCRAVPVVRDGCVAEWIAATADVEDVWRTQLRERLLAQIAEHPRTSPARAFGTVVETIVPEVADACLILTLDHDEWPVPSHVALRAGRIASASRPGLPATPALLGQSLPVTARLRELLEEGVPRTFVVPPGGSVPPDLVPPVTERWLTAAGATSVTLVPLMAEDALLGYAVAATCDDSPVPGPAETDLLRDVLHHAQQPIHRVLEHGRARRTALRLQRAHLTRPPEVPGASLAARYQPASSSREIGGDWYDAFPLPDRSVVLDIGDVAGHDLAAAASMGQMRSMLRALAYSCGLNASPCDVLEELDAVAEGLEAAPFTTVVHAHLRPRPDGGWNVAWSNAGHPPPLLVPAHGAPQYLTGPGTDPPLCVDPGLVRTTHHQVLRPGDTLLLYTDGLIERPATTLTRGQNRLVAAALRHRRLPLDELLHRLLALSDHRDDTAMIAFRAGAG